MIPCLSPPPRPNRPESDPEGFLTMFFGQRQFPPKFGPLRLQEGGYGKDRKGRWWIRPPGEGNAIKLELTARIEEHLDGSITLSGVFRGFVLKKGVWNRA